MPRFIMSEMLHTVCRIPEMRTNPPEPEPDPEITREDYEYHTPQERLAAADEFILTLEECWHSIDFLNSSDPDAEDNFPGAKMVIAALINKVKDYRKKVAGWAFADLDAQ